MEDVLGEDVRRADATAIRAAFSWAAHDWHRARQLTAKAVTLGTVDDTVAVSSHHLAGLLALGVGRLDEARSQFAAATAALATVPAAAPPFFSAMTICWVTDDRGRHTDTRSPRSRCCLAAESELSRPGATSRQPSRSSSASGVTPSAALGLLQAAARRFDALDDVYGLAYVTGQRAHTLRWIGELEGAIRCFEQVEALRSSLRDVRAVAMAVAGRVIADATLGRGREARHRAGEVVEWMRRTGDIPGIALTLHTAALVEALLGDDSAALPLLSESIRVGEDTLPIHALGWQWLLQCPAHDQRRRHGRSLGRFSVGGRSLRGAGRQARACRRAKAAQSRPDHNHRRLSDRRESQ